MLAISIMLFILGASMSLQQKPDFSDFFSPTENITLNCSMAHAGEQNGNLILGSSIALLNVDAGHLTKRTKESWHVIGGHSLRPYQILGLVEALDLKNRTVIIPISTPELSFLTTKKDPEKPHLSFNPWKPINFKTMRRMREMKSRAPSDGGHTHFTPYGNTFYDMTISSTSSQTMPFEDEDVNSGVDTLNFSTFIEACDSISISRGIQFKIPILPFKLDEATTHRTRDNLQALEKLNTPRIKVIPLHNVDIDSSHFMDSHHFNRKGARHFTEFLVRSL